MRNLRGQDLLLLLPAALLLGAGLATVQPGRFMAGWAGFGALLLFGGAAIVAAIRWAKGAPALVWVTLLAFALRLAAGTATYLALPIDGYAEPDDQAGYVFTDAHRRDDQAWELAESGASVISAFNRRHYSDQYGGLLALSALTYRLLSPDAHRPLLVLALAALTATLGVPFLWRATGKLWNERLAGLASWLYCLYPESILTGGAQMREPFLLTFIAISLWGFAGWMNERSRSSVAWLLLGLVGMIVVSPGTAVVLVILLAVWIRLRGQDAGLPRYFWIGALALFLAAFLFLAWSLGGPGDQEAGPLGIVVGWFRGAVDWVTYQLERGSGQVQNVFSKLFPAARFAFVVVYGITQPVLPPAIIEPTTLTWHIIGILRALGWYMVLPLLTYAVYAVFQLPAGAVRRTWAWLTGFNWMWILFAAIRAGGDQWDNPRYRLIFFGIQAMVVSMAWLRWRDMRDRWFPRILAAEVLFLAVFSQWYLARYFLIGTHLPIMVVMGLSIAGVLCILVGGAVWDRTRRQPRPKPPSVFTG